MDQNANKPVIPDEFITSKIYVIRDKKVMLDEFEKLKSQFATSSWEVKRNQYLPVGGTCLAVLRHIWGNSKSQPECVINSNHITPSS
jgi:hypothetical protein